MCKERGNDRAIVAMSFVCLRASSHDLILYNIHYI